MSDKFDAFLNRGPGSTNEKVSTLSDLPSSSKSAMQSDTETEQLSPGQSGGMSWRDERRLRVSIGKIGDDYGLLIYDKEGNIVMKLTGDINASKVNFGSIDFSQITVDNIDASKITTGTLNGSLVGITNINADNINFGSLVGRVVLTSSSNQRIVIDPTTDSILIYDAAGALCGSIYGSAGRTTFSTNGDFTGEVTNPKVKMTVEGGIAVKMTNRTGAASVAGTVVDVSPTYDNAFAVAATSSTDPVGVVYQAGVADGAECWVVVSGIANVLLKDSTPCGRSDWAYTSASEAGRIDIATAPITTTGVVYRQVGQCLETKIAGIGVLCKVSLQL